MNQLNRFLKVNFACDKCRKEFQQETAYSAARNWDEFEINYTYCENCVEEEKTCSFNEIDDKIKKRVLCDNPIFDKKKQLCRSHNRQVRKRFDEFTKEMSVSSTAAWEITWEQSGDWRYWWNLEPENKASEKKQLIKVKKTKDFGVPPTEASENLHSREIDKRTLRKTGRIKQFNTGVSEEWLAKLKSIAYEDRLKYVEVLEKSVRMLWKT